MHGLSFKAEPTLSLIRDLQEDIFEAPKRAFALDRNLKQIAQVLIFHRLGKCRHPAPLLVAVGRLNFSKSASVETLLNLGALFRVHVLRQKQDLARLKEEKVLMLGA